MLWRVWNKSVKQAAFNTCRKNVSNWSLFNILKDVLIIVFLVFQCPYTHIPLQATGLTQLYYHFAKGMVQYEKTCVFTLNETGSCSGGQTEASEHLRYTLVSAAGCCVPTGESHSSLLSIYHLYRESLQCVRHLREAAKWNCSQTPRIKGVADAHAAVLKLNYGWKSLQVLVKDSSGYVLL